MAATAGTRDLELEATSPRMQTVSLPPGTQIDFADVIGTTRPSDYADVTTSILTASGTAIVMTSSQLFKSSSGLGGVFIGAGGLFGKDTGGATTFSINATTGLATFEGNIVGGSDLDITGGAYIEGLKTATNFSGAQAAVVLNDSLDSTRALIALAESAGQAIVAYNKDITGYGLYAGNEDGGIGLWIDGQLKWGGYTWDEPDGSDDVLHADGTWGPAGGGSSETVLVDDDEPVSPGQGDLWFETTTGITWMWYDDGDSAQWIENSGVEGAAGADGATGATGATGPGYKATSTTSLACAGSGSKAFTTQAGLAYSAGCRVRATSTGSGDWMEGLCTAYSGTTLTVTMDLNSGTGTRTDWNINATGERGATGSTGSTGSAGTGVPAGGTTGQVLAKINGTDYNTQWVDQTGGGGGSTTGKHAIPVMAGAMRPSFTGGCQPLTGIASASGQPDIITLDFDSGTEEYAQFSFVMPKKWDEGTITARFHWSHAATTTNFAVVWALQAVAISNDDTILVNFGTAVTVTDTGGTTSDIYTSDETSAITVAGTPAAEDVVFFRAYRKAADGSDTMAVDARLHGITVYVTTGAETDA